MSWPSMACVQTRQQSAHTNSDSIIDSAALLECSVRGIFGEGGIVCTLAKSWVQMGSTSTTLAALMRVWSLSA